MSMYAYSNAYSPGRALAHSVPLASIGPAVSVVEPQAIDPVVIDLKKSADARRLFELEQLEVTWEEQTGALWTFMRPRGRPSYNTDLLEDFHAWQRGIVATFEPRPSELQYLLLGSRTAGVFNLGGDLDLFAAKIRARDRQALVAYGESCVRILHRNMNTLGLPMITIGLAQGDALGGGFESLLSFNVIIAERGTKFGFPETMFGLFPGMGAYSLVARRVGGAFAEEMILSGRCYTAEEMKEVGLVHVLAEPGQGVAAAREYMQRNKRRHNGNRAVFQAGGQVNPVTLEELDRIVQIWADTCLQLSDRDLKVMQRLVSAQDQLLPNLQAAE
jgi:DSF synthase